MQTRNVSSTADDSEENSRTREEIQALIQKAKEFSLKHGNTLAHALTQQVLISLFPSVFLCISTSYCIVPLFSL